MPKILLPLLSALILAGCQVINAARLGVENHPSPTLPPVDTTPFEQAGCALDEYGSWTCPPDSPLADLGCDELHQAKEMLGGLDPATPIVECWYYPTRHPGGEQDPFQEPRLFNHGCLMPVYVRYAIYREGQFGLVEDQQAMQATFAPIESPEEALSYTLASTRLEAHYDLQRQPNYRYFVDQLEDTQVTESDGGYEMNLYYYQVCGCGPHTTSRVDVQVNREGEIAQAEPVPAFENPDEDSLCVD
jgi:hypothetical protein